MVKVKICFTLTCPKLDLGVKINNTMKYLWLILLMGIVLVSGCTQYGTQTVAPAQTVPNEQVQPMGVLKEFTIEGSEFKFNPTTLTVNREDKVKVVFKNVGSTGHNFVIGDFSVSTKVVSPGSTQTVEFIADKSGTFDFYCSLPGHRAAGMEGKISVN